MINFLPKRLLMAAATLGLALPATAQGFIEPSDSGFYVSGFVGGFFPDEDLSGVASDLVSVDDDVYFGGALGAKLPFKTFGFIETRAELEVSYSEIDFDFDLIDFADPDDTNVDLIFIQGNTYADLKFGDDPLLIPYIGGGLGVVVADGFGESETEFVTNNSIGVTLPINKLDLYTEGRYTRVWIDGPDFDSFSWTAGLRIRF
ncbi:MAG: hypothetical protein AAF292_16175 [Pseudomonadota bacterium]